MLTAIVCATDLSHRSDPALERAAQLAEQHRVPLHVVHVIDPDLPETLWQAQKDEVRKEIHAALERLALPGRDRTVVEALVGTPSTEIACYIDASKAGLVVLGCPRLSKATHLSFASFTAGRILMAAVAPVLIAKPPGTGSYRNAVVGVDLSPFSKRAALLAASLVPDGTVTPVHACQAPTDETAGARHRERLKAFVEGLCAEEGAGPALSPSSIVAREGEVPQVLRDEAARLGADLIALGTHGRSGLSRALFGSVAEDMLHDMPCDLLIAVPTDRAS